MKLASSTHNHLSPPPKYLFWNPETKSCGYQWDEFLVHRSVNIPVKKEYLKISVYYGRRSGSNELVQEVLIPSSNSKTTSADGKM